MGLKNELDKENCSSISDLVSKRMNGEQSAFLFHRPPGKTNLQRALHLNGAGIDARAAVVGSIFVTKNLTYSNRLYSPISVVINAHNRQNR